MKTMNVLMFSDALHSKTTGPSELYAGKRTKELDAMDDIIYNGYPKSPASCARSKKRDLHERGERRNWASKKESSSLHSAFAILRQLQQTTNIVITQRHLENRSIGAFRR